MYIFLFLSSNLFNALVQTLRRYCFAAGSEDRFGIARRACPSRRATGKSPSKNGLWTKNDCRFFESCCWLSTAHKNGFNGWRSVKVSTLIILLLSASLASDDETRCWESKKKKKSYNFSDLSRPESLPNSKVHRSNAFGDRAAHLYIHVDNTINPSVVIDIYHFSKRSNYIETYNRFFLSAKRFRWNSICRVDGFKRFESIFQKFNGFPNFYFD